MFKLTPHVQLLLAVAWVDGRLDPAEALYLEKILAHCGLSEDHTQEVLAAQPQPLDLVLQKIPPQPQEAIMRDVLRMVLCDEIVEFEEFDLIQRLAGHLSIDEQQLERLRLQVVNE